MSSRNALLRHLPALAALVTLAISSPVQAAGEPLVVYTARKYQLVDTLFQEYGKERGIDVKFVTDDGAPLIQRLTAEGAGSPADLFITVDAGDLWRATQAGLLQPVRSPALEAAIPAHLRDPEGHWFGLAVRARTIAYSTARVKPAELSTYADLADPRWKGKLCLRSGTSEYNVSFVADRLAKDGRAATEAMLRRWMANDPKILSSDTDVLEAIKDGDCDVGLTNTYYLGRELADDPNFPVAPVWADQNGRGTQVNLSGLGVITSSDKKPEAEELIKFLREPSQQELFARNNHEYPAVSGVKPDPVMARFGTFKRDMIDVAGAGPRLAEALKLMDEVGWD